MSLVKIINFFLIAGVIQGFGFNLVTLFVKKKFNKTVVFLNLTVLFISFNNLQRWLIDNGFSSDLFFVKSLLVPWYVLIFPMFYAFTTHFLKIEDRVNDFIKPTLILFVFEIVLRLSITSYVYFEVPNRDVTVIDQYTIIEEVFNLIFSIFLFVSTILIVFRRHQLLEYILAFDDLKWLKRFIKYGVIVVVFWSVAVIIKSITNNEDAYALLRLSSSVLLYWIGYQGFYKYNVVNDRIFLRSQIVNDNVLISNDVENLAGNSKSEFTNEKHQSEFNRIKNHIISNKLYLDPLLSMETLALEMGISKSHFSKLINSYSNYNFSDFINALRVEQAKKFLSNDEFKAYTIVAIGLECGFNSKSTFYSAFKKFTSITPTSHRELYH